MNNGHKQKTFMGCLSGSFHRTRRRGCSHKMREISKTKVTHTHRGAQQSRRWGGGAEVEWKEAMEFRGSIIHPHSSSQHLGQMGCKQLRSRCAQQTLQLLLLLATLVGILSDLT